jgi:ParB family chromosome partitioning protein
MAKPRQSLVQGLSDAIAQKFIANPANVESPQTLPLQQIHLNQKQPRRYFDPEKQAQLVKSIQEHGILEPLLVRPFGNSYELIAGERRYRAAQEIGLDEIPVVIRDFDDRQALQVALMENLQREDLNPVEETEGILELLVISLNLSKSEVTALLHRANHAKNRDLQLEDNVILQLETVESVLAVVGKFTPESFRVNRLPLLNLPEDILTTLRQGKLEYTKARVIARIKDEQQRSKLLKQAVTEKLSLGEIKERLKELKPEVEVAPEQILMERFANIGKRLRKSEIWSDRRKNDRVTKLLDELDKLITDDEQD